MMKKNLAFLTEQYHQFAKIFLDNGFSKLAYVASVFDSLCMLDSSVHEKVWTYRHKLVKLTLSKKRLTVGQSKS